MDVPYTVLFIYQQDEKHHNNWLTKNLNGEHAGGVYYENLIRYIFKKCYIRKLNY